MNKTKLLVMLSLFVILMTVFGSVFAQDSNAPAFKVSSVTTDEKVVLTTKFFPADTQYTVSMADSADPENFTPVARFNSQTGGSLNVTVKIPEKFHGLYTIELMLQDAEGAKFLGNFVNNEAAAPEEEPVEEETVEEETVEEETVEEETVEEEPVEEETVEEETVEEETVEEETAEETITLVNQQEESVIDKPLEESVLEEPTAAEDEVEDVEVSTVPAEVCDYTVIPTVSIDAVTANTSVTFTTANFPANTTFTVSMGVYVSSWTPDPKPQPGNHQPQQPGNQQPQQPGNQQQAPAGPVITAEDLGLYPVSGSSAGSSKPVPGFTDIDKPAEPGKPQPSGTVTTSFSGIEVGTFSTGDGSAQTLTFQIPEQLKGVSPIALWINDLGPCGFYSYNYFYNVSTSW